LRPPLRGLVAKPTMLTSDVQTKITELGAKLAVTRGYL